MFLRLFDEAAENGTTVAPATSAESVGSGSSGATTSAAPANTGESSGGRTTTGVLDASGAPLAAQSSSSGVAPESGVSAQQVQAPDLFDRLKTFGGPDLRGKYQDENELLKGMANAVKRVRERDDFADLGRQVQPVYSEFQQWMASRGQQQQPQVGQPGQQQQQQVDPYWDYDQPDPSWAQFRIRNEDGTSFDWAQNTPVEVRSSFDKWAGWRHRFDTQWQRDPKALMTSLIKQVSKEENQENIGQYDSQQTAKSIGEQTKQWMYQRNQNGEVLRDPITMQPQLVPQYQYYHEALQEVFADGLTDPVKIDKRAKEIATGRMAMAGMLQPQGLVPVMQQQAAAPAIPVPPGAYHMPSVAAGAGSTGTGVRAQPPYDDKLDMAQRIIAGWRHNAGAA